MFFFKLGPGPDIDISDKERGLVGLKTLMRVKKWLILIKAYFKIWLWHGKKNDWCVFLMWHEKIQIRVNNEDV